MFIRTMVLLTGILFTQSAPADLADRGGHGGDTVRSRFMEMGRAVTNYLSGSEEGRNLVRDNNIDLVALGRVLTVDVISTDNFGDDPRPARTERNRIVLNRTVWQAHINRGNDVYYLVFQNMLDASGKEGNNEVLARALFPFPANFRIAIRPQESTNTRNLSYEERRSHLIRRGRSLSLRCGERFQDNLRTELEAHQARINATPASVPAGTSTTEYTTLFNEAEDLFNRVEQRLRETR